MPYDVYSQTGADAAFATAAQGAKADTAVQPADLTSYATAAQGTTADSAVQPGDDAADLGSAAANDGYVLTADGAGGAAWSSLPASDGGEPDAAPLPVKLRRGTSAQWATADPVLSAGEPGVDLTTGDLRLGDGVGTWANLPSQLNKRAKGATITPDDFPGTDHAKLQAAVNHCTANGYPTIILDRMLDLTGAAAVSIDKVPSWTNRAVITFEGSGGGVIKNDAGTVFTSATANTGDITVRGVKFESTSGAGTILWDADKLLRLSFSENEYRNWDLIISQTTVGRWAQSVRVHKEHVVGGTGPAILFRESYDVTVDDCLFEDRTAVLWNSDGTMPSIANRNLRITNNVMENLSGVPLKLAMCWGVVISSNYFEQNGGPTDPQIDLHTLTGSSAQRALEINGNTLQQTAAQKAAKVGAVLIGFSLPASPLVLTGNVQDGGILFQCATGAIGHMISTGNYSEAGGLVAYPGQEHRFWNELGATGATSARPKNPVIGRDVYFDTTLGKPVWPKTAGVVASASLRLTAGATTSGTITITMLGTAYNVAVTAGDTLTQVRDKIVAAATTFFPTWRPAAYLTTSVLFTALQKGNVSGTLVFAAGGTGVTYDYFGLDVPGTNVVWVDGAGVTV